MAQHSIAGGERQEALRVVRAVLAAEYACDEGAFLADGVRIVPAEVRPGRRRFALCRAPLALATMGTGVVVTSHSAHLPWALTTLAALRRDALFDAPLIGQLAHYLGSHGQVARGPDLRAICTRADLRPLNAPAGVTIALLTGPALRELDQYPGFDNALGYSGETERPDVIAAVATSAGEVVGIAGVSADAERLWQIGIDVVPQARGKGIGRALVGHATAEVLRQGCVPYYSTAVSNIASRALATSLGYWPCWVELFAQDR